jgi:hypothetical protein
VHALLSVMRWFSGYEFALIHFLVGLLVRQVDVVRDCVKRFCPCDDLFEDSEEVEEK